MDQYRNQAGKDDVHKPGLQFFDENEAKTVVGTTEAAEAEFSTLIPPSALMITFSNVPESSSPGKIEKTTNRLLLYSPRRRKIVNAVRVLFLGTLPEVWEVTQRDNEN